MRKYDIVYSISTRLGQKAHTQKKIPLKGLEMNYELLENENWEFMKCEFKLILYCNSLVFF